MAAIDFAALAAPVSEAEPCGPDFDLAEDTDFMQFVARAEGALPTSFFGRDPEGRPSIFDRTSIDFDGEFGVAKKLLADSRDVRLLTIVAKLLALSRDLGGFASCVDCVATLLDTHWADVHPRGEGGDFALRLVSLQTLDDPPSVIFPLQHIPLVTSRRFGAISFRSYLIATGEVKPREGEEAPDAGSVDTAFMEADLAALNVLRGHFATLQNALSRIRRITLEQAGFEQAVSFDKLVPLADKALALLDGIVVRRDPSATPLTKAAASPAAERDGPGDAASEAMAGLLSAIPAGSIASAADAAGALAAVAAYFRRSEPSSPAALLVQQAEQLMGKSFLEVMRILVPTHADQATIHIGTDQPFELSMDQLSALTGDGSSGEWSDGETEAPAASFEAKTRQDAIALLDQIGAFYRAREPSSPIPLLTQRARELAHRDFLGILKDVLPGVSLRKTSTEE